MQTSINLLPPKQWTELQTLISTHLGETFPALSIAALYRGVWLLKTTDGWVDPDEQHHPVTSDTLFDLASVTKLFVETAFLQLVSAGKIALDDPLVSVIPEFGTSGRRPLNGGQDPHTREMLPTPHSLQGQTVDPALVTFRHLLTHSSGLAPWRDVFNAAGKVPPPPTDPDFMTRSERWTNGLSAICGYPFIGQPGESVHYSDLGVMLLGEATARLRGVMHVGEAVSTYVTEPLGLTSVTYNPVRDKAIALTQIAPTEYDNLWRKRRAWGEVHDENACGVGGIAGHAGLFAVAADVASFGHAWLTRDPRLGISPDLIAEATREQRRNGFRFGLGWMLRAYENASAGEFFSLNTYGHTGFTGTSLWIDPDRKFVVACLTNRVYPGREREGIHAFRRALHDCLAQSV